MMILSLRQKWLMKIQWKSLWTRVNAFSWQTNYNTIMIVEENLLDFAMWNRNWGCQGATENAVVSNFDDKSLWNAWARNGKEISLSVCLYQQDQVWKIAINNQRNGNMDLWSMNEVGSSSSIMKSVCMLRCKMTQSVLSCCFRDCFNSIEITSCFYRP